MKKSNLSMNLQTGRRCIDDIFNRIPQDTSTIEVSFIGGEPFLEIELIKRLYDYAKDRYPDPRLRFFATTNGTVLSSCDKKWLAERKNDFIVGLSLDGRKETHDLNRSNSYDDIDIPFFVSTWPKQGPKMTISKFTLEHLAEDIIHIHELGFKDINGVNFAEGDFDWGDESTLKRLASQLQILLTYYCSDYSIKLDQMFAKHIEFCLANNKRENKSCGLGSRTCFYDVDGERYPCSFITPMTFSRDKLSALESLDLSNPSTYTDEECSENCLIYPICGTCSGANYLINGHLNQRIKTRCDMNKIISIYIAEYHMRRILQAPETYEDKNQLYFIIEAIKEIRNQYYDSYRKYLPNF